MDFTRLNYLWFASIAAPAIIGIAFTFYRRVWITVLGVFSSLIITYALCIGAVSLKWNLRMARAQTAEELARATNDGANLAFSAMFSGPLEAILTTALWVSVGVCFWRNRLKDRVHAHTQ